MSKRTTISKKTSSKRPAKLEGDIELIARAVIVERSHILLCRNVKHGYYFLPGGHVEFYESAGAALSRELLEECGMDAETGRLLVTTEHLFTRPPLLAKPGSKGKKAAGSKPRACHEINLVFHVEPRWPVMKPGRSRKAAGAVQAASAVRPTPLPVVESKEAKIAFDWVDLAAVVDLDLRPLSIKAWLMGDAVAQGERSESWLSEAAS